MNDGRPENEVNAVTRDAAHWPKERLPSLAFSQNCVLPTF